MNDSIIISKLNHQVKSLTLDLEKKKKYISKLESSFIELQNKFSDLRSKYFLSSSKEIEYQKMKIVYSEKDLLISELEQELSKIRKKFEIEQRLFNARYQHDIQEVQYLNGQLNKRNENTIKIEKLNDLLYNHTLQLEQKILDYKKEEQKRVQERELEFEKKTNEIKKKMLDFIREGKNLKEKNDQDQYQILQKFSIMNHNTLLNELEFESLQLEDLLKQREHLDKIILKMKYDIEIHKKVEKILINKNKKYTDMLRLLNDIINVCDGGNNHEDKSLVCESSRNMLFKKIKQRIDKNNNKNINTNEFNKTQPLIKMQRCSSMKKLDDLCYKFKKLNINQNKNYSAKSNEKKRGNQKGGNKSDINLIEKIDLQRDLIKKTKELEDFKSKCDFYKEKLNSINDKYKNIINLFDEALSKLYEENKLDDIKEISKIVNLISYQKKKDILFLFY